MMEGGERLGHVRQKSALWGKFCNSKISKFLNPHIAAAVECGQYLLF
jgi:hypothetical protein